MNDIRQSPQFASFMQDIGWHVKTIGYTKVYVRTFPIFGSFAKIPRSHQLIEPETLRSFIKKHRVFHMKISPFLSTMDSKYEVYKGHLMGSGFSIDTQPFNPTTTITINLKQSEDTMFSRFTEAKRRAVRRAIKNNIIVKATDDIDAFIEIRKKQYAPLGFLMTHEMRTLWNNFYPNHASLLLAYSTIQNKKKSHIFTTVAISYEYPIAGILLLFCHQIAYYWYASALPEGKKLFAPTLLVWEAVKLSKKRGCILFDFEGIADERFPKASSSWRGFTKFKEGFGGETVISAENFRRISFPL